MILEIAPLHIRADQSADFEAAFLKAQHIIASIPGHISHELQRCLERTDEYVLLVRWESVEAHEVGFRLSKDYGEWKRLLHHFYDPFPVVSHYRDCRGGHGVSTNNEAEIHLVSDLKRQLAKKYRFDREAYTEAKGPFIRRTLDRCD